MTIPDVLEEATRRLRESVADPGDLQAMPPGRDEAIARIAEALRTREKAQRRSRTMRVPLVAAAVFLLASGGALAVRRAQRPSSDTGMNAAGQLARLGEPSGNVTALRDGRSETALRGERLAEGTELRTSNGAEASLEFDSGTRVTIGGGSRLRLVEQTARKRFALESGDFSAKVAKLGADERFIVTTPDAEIEVRGTAFRVTLGAGDVGCEKGTKTRLDVSEGVVVVRHDGAEQRVAAGEHWPTCAGNDAGAALAADLSPSMQAQGGRREAGRHGAGTSTRTPRPDASSRLAEQNDLFDEAMRLRHGGDAAGAVARLDRLLADYPSGPLVESAAAERMRILAVTDKARALTAARDYLRQHPHGFARAEADAIVAGAP